MFLWHFSLAFFIQSLKFSLKKLSMPSAKTTSIYHLIFMEGFQEILVLLHTAQSQEASDQFEDAVSSYTKIIEKADSLPPEMRAMACAFRSLMYSNLDMRYEAAVDVNTALNLAPESPLSLMAKGKALMECSFELEQANALFEKVEKLKPGDQTLAMCMNKLEGLLKRPRRSLRQGMSCSSEKGKTITDARVWMEMELSGRGCDRDVTLSFIKKAIANMEGEGPIVRLDTDARVTVVGNLDGRMGHLMNIFDKNGWPSEDNRYIFNGNIIGFQENAVLLMCALLLLKSLNKNCVYFNKGL